MDSRAKKTNSNPKKIFIVEDDSGIREFLESTLKDMNYQVESCASGKDAFAMISAGNPHLVLMDILLDDLDGLNLCRKVKSDSKTRHIPVIMLSCLSDSSTMKNADSFGASDFIAKPFKQAVLKAKIEANLA